MRAIISTIVLCFSVWSVSAAMAADRENAKSSDSWRFKFHQGHWWYWLPANRWAVYENGRWLLPPEQSPKVEAKEGGSFAEDYPVAPVTTEPAKHSADYYLSVGNVFSKHAHEHAEVLERYAASGETVPANIVKEQAKAIHRDVDQAQKSFSQVSVADEETTSDDLPGAVKRLQVSLSKVTESLRRLESQVQRQGAVEATLVRGQTAIINRLFQQANEAARAAEEAQRKYEQNQKDLAGVD